MFLNKLSLATIPYRLIALSAVLYGATGYITFFLEQTNLVVQGIFIPEGISLALGLLYGPAVAVGVFVGQFFLLFFTGAPLEVSLFIALSNALILILVLSVAKRLKVDPAFHSIKDYFNLIILSFAISAPVSAVFGHFILYYCNEILFSQIFDSFVGWYGSNALAQSLVTPLLLIFLTRNERLTQYSVQHLAPAFIIFLVIYMGFFVEFSDYPITFILIPLLFWLAYSKKLGLLAFTAIASLMLITSATSVGMGPIASYQDHALVALNIISYGMLLPAMFGCVLLRENSVNEVQILRYAETQYDRAQSIETQLLSTLNALSMARDNETGNHIIRTQNYVKLIAEQLRSNKDYLATITADYVDSLFKAAPLHDIGKVGIPDSILLHPGPLAKNDWEIMKTHATIGEKVLSSVIKKPPAGTDKYNQSVLMIAQEIAGGHHEKWDGSGYPRALEKTKIPLSARIMAIADMYDALVNERVYKSAWTHEEAIDEIKKLDGTHFDPKVVSAFLHVEEQVKIISLSFKD